MKYIVALTFALQLLACNRTSGGREQSAVSTAPDPSLMVPGHSFGVIKQNFDYDSLLNYIGKANMVDEERCGAECLDTFIVTILWKDKPQECEVMWQDSAFHKKMIGITMNRVDCPFHTADSIGMQSTLTFIEAVNGKPVSFSGFGWDYGGGISNYNGGRLENSMLVLTLDCNQPDCNDKYTGDTIFISTDLPMVEKNKIKVSQMFFRFK